VTVSCPESVTYDGSAQTPCSASYTTDDGQSGDLTVNYSGDNVNVGTVTASADYAGDADHLPSADSKPFDITPASSTVTVTCTVGAPYTYTGLEQTPCTAEATGAGMSPVDVSASLVYGNNTNAGAATADASWEGDSNHNGSSGSGGFTITPASSTVTVICAPSVTWTGSAKTPCLAGATGAGMSPVDVTASLVYGNNINPGTATADASWGGDANHTGSTGSGGFTINKAEANCTVTGYSVTYDGSSHTTTTGTCTGVNDETLSGLDLSATTHTEARSSPYNDTWTFTDVTGNYKDASGPVQDSIAKAEADCSSIIDTYIGTYNGNTYPNGTCTGAGGVDLHASLDLGTTFTNAGSGFTHWKFSGGNNYNDQENDGSVIIIPADATCTVTPYSLIYDGDPHTATGTCHGVKGESLSTLDLNATTHTDAGDYPGDAWTFTASTGNYNNTSGTVNDSIAQAAATCTITGYTGTYDGAAHGAGGSCTLGSVTLDGLDLGLSFTNVPGGTANWTFTNPNVSNSPQSGSVDITINKANPTCTIIGWTGNYDGSPHGASGSCIGVGGGTLSVLNLGATFTNRSSSSYTANWTFTDSTGNYNNQSGSVSITISRGPTTTTVTCLPANFTYTGNSIRPPCSARVTLTSTGAQILGPTNMPNQSGSSGSNNYNYNYSNNTNVGTATATFNYEQNGNYAGSRGDNTFTITPATATCTITNPSTYTYDGAAHGVSGACTFGGNTQTGLTSPTFTEAGTWPTTWTFTNSNFISQSGSVNIVINKTTATCTISGYTGTYDGAAHGASGNCRRSGSNQNLQVLDLGATFTNVPGGTANWTFTNPNITNSPQSGSVPITINKASSNISSSNLDCPNVTYNGSPQTPCTATATGAGGLNVSVPLSGFTYTNNTNAGTANVSVQYAGDQNHNASNTRTRNFTIRRADATCSVTGYTVPYDGAAHTATGSCTGVLGETVTGLDLTGTTHTNAGDYPNDPWSLNNTNYTATGTVHDIINAGSASCTVTPYNVPYDGTAHTAGYECTVGGLPVSGTLSGTTHTDAGSYNDNWTFTDVTGNYAASGGPIADSIAQTSSTLTMTCPASVPWTGSPIRPCSATVTGAGVVSQTVTWTYSNNTDVGTATANADFAGDTNHTGSSGWATFEITKSVVCTVTGYSVTYNAVAHTASGSCISSAGGDVSSGLNLDGTTHTNAGNYNDTWTFHDPAGNYDDMNGTVSDSIGKVDADCNITASYIDTYNGNTYPNGTCTGVGGVTLDGLNLGTTYKNAGSLGITHWTFTNANYNPDSGYGLVIILRATATCTFSNYTVIYDGLAHGAIGTCTGVPGEDLSASIILGPGVTNVPGGTATWRFTNSNYNSRNGTVTITITKAPSLVTVTCPTTAQLYTGLAQTPCTAVVTGAGGLNLPLTVSYSNNTNVGTATASANYAGDSNHLASDGSATFGIRKASSSVTVTCPASMTYTGSAFEPCTASYSTEDGLTGSLTPTYKDNINAGTATASADYAGDENHESSSGSATFEISKANATCQVEGYNVTYDGEAHTATGTCTGVQGEGLDGLDLSATTHTNAGSYTDTWTFHDDTGNYNDASDTVSDSIARAEATCTVNGYDVTYDGDPHTATGMCTGVKGESLSGLDLSATTHTNAGEYPTDAWTFTDVSGNYNDTSGTVSDSIARAEATCTVTAYTVTFDGSYHTATGACLGVKGETLSGLDLSATSHNLPGDYPGDAWTFTDVTGNYNNTNGTVHDSIAKADATCTVTAYTVTYDGSSHTATGSCTGIWGESLSGLILSATTHTEAGDYPGDAWTFNDVTGNYNNTNGTVHDSIAKAEATCTVTAYTVTYDGSSHTATGSCTGVWDDILSGLDLSATTHTEAGDYPGDAWTLNNTNYAASGTVHDSIAKADATCMIIGDTRIYDGAEHGASGACTGVGGVTLNGLNLGSKHDHVPGGTVNWTFTNANYNNQSGSVSITINKAPSLVTVTCPFSVPYTGSAQKPCSALVTGAGGLNQPLTVEYNGNTNIGTATANADFAGDTDHTGSSGFKEFTITSAGVPGIPGIGAEETPTATSVPPISPANLKEDIAVGSDMKAPVLTNETQVSPALPTLSTTEVIGSDQGTVSAPVEPATVGESQTPKILSTLSGSLGCIGAGFLGLLIFFMFKRRKKEDQE
jgi:hypothetical protein